MNKKINQEETITGEIIKQIDNQIKSGLNIKEFNKLFHKIITKSIEEQLI